MIRQICPHCFASVEFADEAAGTTADCPVCRKAFPVPGRYAPSVAGDAPPARPLPEAPVTSRPAPPPGLVPPAEAARPPLGDAPAPPTASGPGVTLTLSPTKLGWLPVACFTLILLLTFFTWVGLFPGGFKAYSQSPWGALARDFDTNPFSEEVLQLEKPLATLMGRNWLLLLPYLVALVAAVVLGWADRAVSATHVTGLPGPVAYLRTIWPYRLAVLFALAALTLALLAVQVRVGFGLDTATRQLVADRFAEALQATENSAAKQKILVKQGMELGQYELQTTWWLTLALTLHVVAAVAAGLRLWLDRRGAKPLPRVTVTA